MFKESAEHIKAVVRETLGALDDTISLCKQAHQVWMSGDQNARRTREYIDRLDMFYTIILLSEADISEIYKSIKRQNEDHEKSHHITKLLSNLKKNLKHIDKVGLGFYKQIVSAVIHTCLLEHEQDNNIQHVDLTNTEIEEPPVFLADKCSICLEDSDEQDALKRLSCGHIFHYYCVETWLKVSSVS